MTAGSSDDPAEAAEADDGSPFRDRAPLPTAEALAILTTARIDPLGRMPYSSNGTFLVDLWVGEDCPAQAIYKPEAGEQPLWDFPPKLWKREVGAFELSNQLGWGHVPPTIERDGPLGIGSLQLFVPAEFEEHYFTMLDDESRHEAFREICAFDFVANNTDRKSGHVLLGIDDEIHAIDNGLSFHSEFKLRTVIWDFAGEFLPQHVRDGLERLLDEGVVKSLADRLDTFENDALLTRTRALLRSGVYPDDPTGRRWPWPMV